jgi:hypothetical protein
MTELFVMSGEELKKQLRLILTKHKNNKGDAARAIGVPLQTFERMLETGEPSPLAIANPEDMPMATRRAMRDLRKASGDLD